MSVNVSYPESYNIHIIYIWNMLAKRKSSEYIFYLLEIEMFILPVTSFQQHNIAF